MISRQTNAVVLWGTVRASKSRIQLKVACRLSKTKQQSLWGCTWQISKKMAIWQRCRSAGRKQKWVPRVSCIQRGHLMCLKIIIIESNQRSFPLLCTPPYELTGTLMWGSCDSGLFLLWSFSVVSSMRCSTPDPTRPLAAEAGEGKSCPRQVTGSSFPSTEHFPVSHCGCFGLAASP